MNLYKKKLQLKKEIDKYNPTRKNKRKGHLIYKYNEILNLINRFGLV